MSFDLNTAIALLLDALSHTVHQQHDFLCVNTLESETIDGTTFVYRKDQKPKLLIERIEVIGPGKSSSIIFIDSNSAPKNDRIYLSLNYILVRCLEPNSILLLGQDANLFRCEFNLGCDATPQKDQPRKNPPLVAIANGVSITESRFNLCSDTFIAVGQCSAIAKNAIIRTHDDHAIIDLKSRTITNKPASIVLQGYNWICESAVILKGVTIGYGSILAMHSLVSGSLPNTCLACGTPARVTRENVSWQSNPHQYDQQQMLCYLENWLQQEVHALE